MNKSEAEKRADIIFSNIMNGYHPTHGIEKEGRKLPKYKSPLENKQSKRLMHIVNELKQFSNLNYYKNLIKELEEELNI